MYICTASHCAIFVVGEEYDGNDTFVFDRKGQKYRLDREGRYHGFAAFKKKGTKEWEEEK